MSENLPAQRSNNENAIAAHPLYKESGITTSADFIDEVRSLNADTTLTYFQKNSIKKQILKKYLSVKEQELSIKEQNYINSLKMVDHVTSQVRASAAQKAILNIEADFQEFVGAIGIENDDRLMSSLIKHAEMVNQQFKKLDKADIDPEMREELFTDFRTRAKQTKTMLITGIEDYLEKVNSKR